MAFRKCSLLLIGCFIVTAVSAASAQGAPLRPVPAPLGASFPPFGFEKYGEQFVARAGGYSVSLSKQEVRVILPPVAGQRGPDRVSITFPGCNKTAQPEPEETMAGVIHYYLGDDPKHWRTDVRRFRRVHYREIYPGVGLVFYGRGQRGTWQSMEFDFELAPGHEVSTIAMNVEGAIAREVEGNVELITPSGNVLVLQKPELYQIRRGKREPVQGAYVVREGGKIGFSVSSYDPTLPLTIDPALAYSTLIQDLMELTLFPGQFPAGTEGFEFDGISGMVSDSTGDVYITGRASVPDPSLGFQPGSPPLPISKLFIEDAFVAKLDPSGSNLLYTAYLGGDPSQLTGASATKIALDAAGNAFIVGITNSPTFATTPGVFNRVPACSTELVSNKNCSEPFAAKFDTAGHLVFSTYLLQGGSTDSAGPALGTQRIAVDSSGAVYVAGNIFPALIAFPQDPTPASVPGLTVTPGAFQTTRNSSRSGYVLKLHPDGSVLDYSSYLGGSTSEFVGGIAADSTGVAYVDGQTASADFPTTTGAFQTSNAGKSAFFTKLKPDGSGLLFSTFLGATGIDSEADAIAIDGTNNAFMAGIATGPGFPTTPGAFKTNVTGAGSFNFLSEFDSGNNLALSTYIGDGASVSGVKVDTTGIYVAGTTGSPAYPLLNSIEPPPVNGEAPIYVSKLNLTGSALLYSTLVGTAVAGLSDLGIDASQNVYLAGSPTAVYPTTIGAFQPFPRVPDVADQAGFVAKIAPSLGAAVPAVAPRSLTFPDILQQGVASVPLTVRLSNFGDADLTLAGISISGTNATDFAETNNCPAVIPAGTNCTITVVFTPTVPSGARSASLIVAFGGGPVSQSVALNGKAGTPAFQISPAVIDFGTFGTLENSIQTFTITNTGTGPLIISSATISPGGVFPNNDFSFGPTGQGPSPGVLQPGQSSNPFQIWMHIGLDFGNLSAKFIVQDNAPGSPRVFSLTGFGFHSTPDFGMSTPNGVPATATVPAGQTATYNVIVASLPGLGLGGGSISVTCTGAPAGAQCNLSRTSLPLPDNNPETVVVSVPTTAATASLHRSARPTWLVVVLLAGILWMPRRKYPMAKLLIMLCALMLTCLMAACGGGGGRTGGPPVVTTPPGTYTLTVTATFGTVSHSFPLTLTVK